MNTVVLSKFKVANGMTEAVKRAFVARPHLVDSVAGFLKMEVLSPVDCPDEIWLLTFWADPESYRTWHRSHQHHESHAHIPKGLRLDPKATSLRLFEHVAS